MTTFQGDIVNRVAGSSPDVIQDIEARAEEYGRYSPTLLVGLGGTGARALQRVRQLTIERFGALDRLKGVRYLSIDTDLGSIAPDPAQRDAVHKNDPLAAEVAFQEGERINLAAPLEQYLHENNILQHEHIRSWLDPVVQAIKINLAEGAGQIRPAARLALFHNMFGGARVYPALETALRDVRKQEVGDARLNSQGTLVIVVGSFAGGTGAGIFLDIAAALRAIGGSTTTIIGHFVLPDVFHDKEKATKVRANGYACLTELNHHLEHPFVVSWRAGQAPLRIHSLFDHIFLMDGRNEANQQVSSPDDAYRTIGDNIFSEFFQGKFAAVKRSVRVNRKQYLAQWYTKRHALPPRPGTTRDDAPIWVDAERYRTQFQSFGMSRVVFPGWRLLNAASYLLAIELIRHLDKPLVISTDLARLRAELAQQAGFYQGELTVEGTRSRHWSVCRALKALDDPSGEGLATLHDEIARTAAWIRDPMWAESARREKATGPRIREVERRLVELWSSPSGAARASTRPAHVELNRQVFQATVAARLDKTIEDLCDRERIGPTRVSELLASLSDELRQGRYHYKVQMLEEVARARVREQEETTRYERAVRNAEDAEQSLFVGRGGYREALDRVADALQSRWEAVCDRKIFEEAVLAIEEVARLLDEKRQAQEVLSRDLGEMSSRYQDHAELYSRKDSSPGVEEIDPGLPPAHYLREYLGETPDARAMNLDRLFKRIRERLGIHTNPGLLRRVQEDRAGLSRLLREQCWLSLRGKDGWTHDFTAEGGQPKRGFIERYSVLKVLHEQYKSPDAPEIARVAGEAWKKAKAWIYPTDKLASIQGAEAGVHRDCFVAVAVGDDPIEKRVHSAIEAVLKNQNDGLFRPQFVSGSDPCEIVIYTETTAFIPAWLSSLHGPDGMKAAYDHCMRSRTVEAALHTDKHIGKYTRLVPLDPAEVGAFALAWKRLVRGLLTGTVRTEPGPELGNEAPELGFDEVRQGNRTVTRLGLVGQAIDALMSNRGLTERLELQMTAAWERAGQRPIETLALIRYYRYCLFPALITEGGPASGGGRESRASMAWLALEELEEEVLRMGRLSRSDRMEASVAEAMQRLPEFTRLTGRRAEDVSGLSAGHGRDYAESSATVEREELRRLAHALLPGLIAGPEWERRDVFPWLALDPAKADLARAPAERSVEPAAPVGPPPLPGAVKWFHSEDGETSEPRAEAELIGRIAAAPTADHLVWKEGMADWLRWREVPALVEKVAQHRPPGAPPPLPGRRPADP